MKRILAIASTTLLALSFGCKEPAASQSKEFDVLSASSAQLENLLSGPIGQRLKSPDLARADITGASKLLVLGQSGPGLEGNAEGECSTQGDKVLCMQVGFTTTQWGFELPKGGVDAGALAKNAYYFLGRVFGVIGSKRPVGFENASYSVQKVQVKRSIRDFSETVDAYLFEINTENKRDRTARTSSVYLGTDGKVLGASFVESPGRDYGASGQPYSEFQIVG